MEQAGQRTKGYLVGWPLRTDTPEVHDWAALGMVAINRPGGHLPRLTVANSLERLVERRCDVSLFVPILSLWRVSGVLMVVTKV